MKFDFTEQIKQKTGKELNEIFIRSGDYDPEFVSLAEQELLARNINLDSSREAKERNKQINLNRLGKGKAGNPVYIAICFVLAALGGLLAVYAGFIYSQSKTTTENGERFPAA